MSIKVSDSYNIRQIFAANLTRFMKEQNVTRRKLSDDLGIKYTTLCDWVNGNSSPKPEAVKAMGDYFGVSVSDFYIELEKASDPYARLLRYSGKGTVMEMELLKSLSDEQIRELLKKGFTFRHKTLEERAKEFGELIVDGEFDCGEPVGREVW
ncbi:MAG: helix-turn-helix transcriptional regulator [Lachnospiraceae bacterium]|nr:helix-turn-helix transcriptional regulator [Lachnospiraceae bacterium]